MMKIVVAVDSFKGSLSSLEAGRAAARGVAAALPQAECTVVPVADGGEGTVDALVNALGGQRVTVSVCGPLGAPVQATYGLCGPTAVIEMAAASGLTLLPEDDRNPMITSSFGTGQLIRDALLRGCRRFLIGIGGSATNDAGIGMLQDLGYHFYDRYGQEVSRSDLADNIVRIDCSRAMPELKGASFTVACDVSNPLTGPQGASHVFGPQKGATPEMAERLDRALASFAQTVAKLKGGEDLSMHPGAGAAGGLGFALLSFLGARLVPGIDMVLDAVDFDWKLEGASLVITGEGRLDSQTSMGKTPYGVLLRSKARNIPVIAIGGAVDPDAVGSLTEAGFSAVFPVVAGPVTLDEAMRPEVASRNVERTVGQIIRARYTSSSR